MSQHAQYDEPREDYQAGYTFSANVAHEEVARPLFNEKHSFDEFPAQKLSAAPATPAASPGNRLALAIVSVLVLIPAISMLLGNPDLSFYALVFRIAAFALICLTLMVINLAFNRVGSTRK